MGITELEPESVSDYKYNQLRDFDKYRAAECAAECAALAAQVDADSDLARVITIWPTLTEPVRQRIVGLVEAVELTNE